MALLQRSEIERLIPHRAAALWLNSVTEISDSGISGTMLTGCTHLFGSHPEPCLLFEAAAQLCAVHGASKYRTKTNQPDVKAFVAKVQQLTVHCRDDMPHALLVTCQIASSNPSGALYRFEIYGAHSTVISGKLLVVTENAAA